ncbi:IS3 family transposase [Formosa sp. PL04]|uniref:IS3 family transposase n=1 Tax=Formosa sp. PL04 TaxID=3081755 RepID=UPI002981AC3A|nr:IS3 family transposase [Formosa sp. PL04]MDW5288525.1 IS3 family transposase [Formosa sp. PL04]
MNQLYQVVGISKQAVYQYANRQALFTDQLSQLILEADDLRLDHPGCGVEKMYQILNPSFIGRDRFIETMMSLGYRLKKKRNYKRTTISSKKYYPNLIKGLEINKPSGVWQSDITYLPLKEKHYYAVFIIDVYTKKIVGHQVSDNMRAEANMKALNMALKTNKPPEIHHSDRGSQYTYSRYIERLKNVNAKISMSLSGLDNAYAERINRTIKEEYLNYWKPQTFYQLKRCVKKAVDNYNSKRTHKNLPKMSPRTFEKYWYNLEPENRPKMSIFNNEIIN